MVSLTTSAKVSGIKEKSCLAAVHFDDAGQAWLHPGLARCKLWGNALEKLDIARDAGVPVRPGMDKYALDMETWSEPERLTHVYELLPKQHGVLGLEAVKGLKKLGLLDRQTYRPGFIDGLGLKSGHLKRLGLLAGQVSTAQLTRPMGAESTLNAMISLLERDWA